MSLENFDIKEYLEDRRLHFWEEGKNVHKGWINVTCPFCGDHSHSGNNHLGINKESKMTNCWICGPRGSIVAYIQKIESCSWQRAELILESFQDKYGIKNIHKKIKQHEQQKSNIILSKEFTTKFPQQHIDYLINRNFDPKKIIPKYKLLACNNLSKYKFRIIIPIIMNNNIVSFTSRDITNKREPKYLHLSNEESALPIIDCIYNVDNVKDRVIITEGVTDVWRIGNGSVAMLGKIFPSSRISILSRLKLKAAFVMFDGESEAIKRAYQLANKLSIFIDHIEVIELSNIDPADLSEDEIKELKKNCF